MMFLSVRTFFCLVTLLCVTANWPVPKSIKCYSTGTFHCKTTGKYEDPFDFTCTRYFLCNEFEHETVEVELTCPENTFYDPVIQHCSPEYKCICDDFTNPTTSVPSTIPSSLKIKSPTPYLNECEICSQCITSLGTKTTTGSTIWTTHSSKATISHTTLTEDKSITENLSESTFPISSEIISSTTSTTIPTSGSTITAATPKYCSIGGNFACSRTGRFANPSDSSCNSYFYCYVWSDRRVDQYLYSCSIGVFNPSKGACDMSYVCPCLDEPTTETTIKEQSSSMSSKLTTGSSFFTTKTNSTTKDQPSFISTQYTTRFTDIFTTTQVPPSISSQSLASTDASTTVSLTIPECYNLVENFTCTRTGRFPNPNDFSCNSYHYCYVGSNDKVEQYLYSCSIGLFNPSKGACDVSYICPCSEANFSTTTQLPSSNTETSSPTQASFTTESTMFTTTAESSKQVSSTTKTTIASTTPKNCNLGNFTCTETGRFENPNDLSCNSYFYCYVWLNGTVGQYLYNCSIGLFNPSKGACDTSYACPCLKETTTNTADVSITTQLPSSSGTSKEVSSTISSTTPKNCNLGRNFTCTETGRFENCNDPSCNSYFYCYVWLNGTVGQYLYNCSIGLFNPSKGACDTSYVCPCLIETTTNTADVSITTQLPSSSGTSKQVSSTTQTTISSTTPKNCNLGRNFTCTETGRFENSNDPSCNSYFYCYVWVNGTVGQYLYNCSIGLFNPSKGACDTSYVCPCLIETTTNTADVSITTQLPSSSGTSKQVSSTTQTTISSTTPKNCNLGRNFICTETGRFENSNDPSCNSYFYCYVWVNGTVGQYLYNCSIGLFNPSKGACDTSYACPCLKETTTNTADVSITTQLPSSSETSKQVSSTTQITISSTTPKNCNLGRNFTCPETGRFENPNDPSCNSYFYCYVWSNGKVGQYLYSCSVGLFNPSKGACDTSYVCPCADTNTDLVSLKTSAKASSKNEKSAVSLKNIVKMKLLSWFVQSPRRKNLTTL